MNEQQFLQNYSQDRYDRPSIATDIAAFSLRTVKSEAYRASPELKLCVLLIRRGGHPFKDHWALPGGFLQRGESIDECAFRELKEETNLAPVSMLWVDTFSQPERDPRGWIISHAYASVIAEEDAKIFGSSDAADAQWFEVSFQEESKDHWHLQLRNGETEKPFYQQSCRSHPLPPQRPDSPFWKTKVSPLTMRQFWPAPWTRCAKRAKRWKLCLLSCRRNSPCLLCRKCRRPCWAFLC